MRRKRSVGVFLIITALIIMLLPVPEADAATSASAFTIKGEKLTKYKGTDRVVTIPSGVEVIGESAFGGNDTIEEVIFSDSVTEIEAYSFWGCDNLRTVRFGKGMTLISDFAFTNCGGLESVTIPANVHYIGLQAFSYCERLEDIMIPPEVTDIAENAFEGDYLLNIHCEPGSYAERYAKDFYERQKNMPVYGNTGVSADNKPQDGIGSLPDGDPSDRTEDKTDKPPYEILGQEIGSTKVVANQAVVLIQNAGLPVQGSGAETGNGGQDGDSVGNTGQSGDSSSLGGNGGPEADGNSYSDRIPQRAHYRDDTLQEAVVADGIRTVEQFAYARSGISRLSLPAGLERIDYAAFYHCDELAWVEIPESVQAVASKAFRHTPWVENFLNGTSDAEGDFLISGGVLVAYRGHAEEVVIPDGVRVIAGETFAGHVEMKKVILPDTLVGIDKESFKGCKPESVEYQGSLLDRSAVEEMVVMSSMSAATEAEAAPVKWKWIAGVLLLLTGSFLLIKRAN